jgi:hypothetical protein
LCIGPTYDGSENRAEVGETGSLMVGTITEGSRLVDETPHWRNINNIALGILEG